MENNNENATSFIETNNEQPTLMSKISNTISSLMPGTKSATKSATKSVSKDTSLFDEVITESRTKSQSIGNLTNDLDKVGSVNSDSLPNDNKGFLSDIGDLFKNMYFKIIMLILILAFLGFNLFTYLADATDITTDIFGDPIKNLAAFFGYSVGETTKNIIDTSAEGTKLGVDVAAGATDDAIDLGQRALGGGSSNTSTSNDVSSSNKKSNSVVSKSSDNDDKSSNNNLDKAINNSSNKSTSSSLPEPDDAGSRTQISKNSKSGYCYIGEDRGFRSCIKVDDPNKCMSGEIFPTRDICINPSLRE